MPKQVRDDKRIMQRKKSFFFIFIVLLILSFVLLKFKNTGPVLLVGETFENIFAPIENLTQNLFSFPKNIFISTDLKKLKEENNILLEKLADQEKLQKENQALKDQFKTSNPQSLNLLPAKIIGAPSFIPGVTNPEHFVLDKGSNQGIRQGQAVVFKDNLIGKIGIVSKNLSVVNLISEKESFFAVKTLKTNALGVVKGQGNGEIILDNVLLSDNLEPSDLVVTKGDLESNGIGLPADLIVGKIESIDKKASSLFQQARVKSTVDFSRLSVVFVIVEY